MKKVWSVIRFGLMLPIYILAWLFMAVAFIGAAWYQEQSNKKWRKEHNG